MTHNEKKNQLTETDAEISQMQSQVNKDLKRANKIRYCKEEGREKHKHVKERHG